MKLVTVKSTQTLFDLALQKYGDADRVFDVIDDLGLENLESDPTGIQYTPESNYVTNYYESRGIEPSNRPIRYYNTNSDALLADDTIYLLQENNYKILL